MVSPDPHAAIRLAGVRLGLTPSTPQGWDELLSLDLNHEGIDATWQSDGREHRVFADVRPGLMFRLGTGAGDEAFTERIGRFGELVAYRLAAPLRPMYEEIGNVADPERWLHSSEGARWIEAAGLRRGDRMTADLDAVRAQLRASTPADDVARVLRFVASMALVPRAAPIDISSETLTEEIPIQVPADLDRALRDYERWLIADDVIRSSATSTATDDELAGLVAVGRPMLDTIDRVLDSLDGLERSPDGGETESRLHAFAQVVIESGLELERRRA